MTMTTVTYASVLVDIETKTLDRRAFTYRVPEGLESAISVGTPVSVPFGRMQQVTGYVVGLTDFVEPGFRVKDIADILSDEPLFDLEYLRFLEWVADYTGATLLSVISAALPASMVQQTRREVALVEDGLSLLDPLILSRPTQQILAMLQGKGAGKPMGVRYLAQKTGLPLRMVNQSLYQLQNRGVVKLGSKLQKQVGQKRIKWLKLSAADATGTMTPKQVAVLGELQALPDTMWPLKDAVKLAKTTPATLQKLVDAGAIAQFEAPEYRDRELLSFYETDGGRQTVTLNAQQAQAVSTVLASPEASDWLLYGVTGSGKTEVYMALVEAMLAQNQSSLILVPEISLTSHIAKRFIRYFGPDQVALWHSQLSAGEKVDTWRRIQSGDLKIVIGARSAIFTPLKDLGLIVMDESHDGSYKQDTPAPRYDARTLAMERIRRTGAKLVMGSATPDVVSYAEALSAGRVIRLTERYGERPLASVEVVDMRWYGSKKALSEPLLTALKETVERGEQAVLLLNRRGFYTLMMCKDCQHVFECSDCSVPLTYHRARDHVRCHYCAHEAPKPQYCSKCASFHVIFAGSGTQRLEEELAEALPEARLLRLDSDVMQKKFAHREVFEAFERHEADILIGTQMVAKGLDVANVTLVGVVSADLSFSLPDYKATERGFQLLTQVAGRAGRGDKPGRVYVQTFQPDHAVIRFAQGQDFDGFYQWEIAQRHALDFPPDCQLFRLIISGPEELATRQFAQAAALKMKTALTETSLAEKVSVLGPAPCLIERIQGRYRYHMMIKSHGAGSVHEQITRIYRETLPPEDIHFLLDVDSQSFL